MHSMSKEVMQNVEIGEAVDPRMHEEDGRTPPRLMLDIVNTLVHADEAWSGWYGEGTSLSSNVPANEKLRADDRERHIRRAGRDRGRSRGRSIDWTDLQTRLREIFATATSALASLPLRAAG